MTITKQYGKILEQQAAQWRPKPVFVDPSLFPDAECPNCNDRGFLTAFFCEFQQSAAVNEHPHTIGGTAMKWVENADGSGAWWVGNHRTYPCPVCRTQVVFHDGRK